MARPRGTVLGGVTCVLLGSPGGQVGTPEAEEQHSWTTVTAGFGG